MSQRMVAAMSLANYSRVRASFAALAGAASLRIGVILVLHLAALLSIYFTEYGNFGRALALLTWGFLNCTWLIVLRRPAMAAVLALVMIEGLILASQFKFSVTDMTASFLDILILDPDTVSFLFMIFPAMRHVLIVVAVLAIPLAVLIWRIDPLRVGLRASSTGAAACLAGIVGLSFAVPEQPWEPFGGSNHISNFTRSGVVSISELMTHGWLERDSTVTDQLKGAADTPCHPQGVRPHILILLDESSFDITAAPGVRVPPGYSDHFRSFDGKTRSLIVESTGGPTWYAEYNVLTGLSARSYGRFMFNVTRIAAGRVRRGLPEALRHCGYRTFSLYPAYGTFLSARRFQTGTGIERFFDLKDMGAVNDLQPDRFYFNKAIEILKRRRGTGPLFIFIYVTANHFPWTSTFRPDLTPAWRPLGNDPEVDEYIRRQTMSARDYADFVARLRDQFPGEPFLIVRFGDHQPAISTKVLEPGADAVTIARRVMSYDLRYFTTYYAIDTINFAPADLSSARDGIEAAYLPIVIQEAAGLPLDPSFAEQKRILERCNGLFYRCAEGAEARRFNWLLIKAGLIQGL